MAISDIYTATVSQTTSAAGPTALTSVFGGATKRAWMVGVRVECTATSAAAGNSSLFQLARPGNGASVTSSTTSVQSVAHDFSAPAGIAYSATTWGVAPTVGSVLADWTIPQTTGSAWEEFPPLGYEWGIPAIAITNANAGIHLFVTQNASSSTYTIQFIWSE